jgi:hypothetical protein
LPLEHDAKRAPPRVPVPVSAGDEVSVQVNHDLDDECPSWRLT